MAVNDAETREIVSPAAPFRSLLLMQSLKTAS